MGGRIYNWYTTSMLLLGIGTRSHCVSNKLGWEVIELLLIYLRTDYSVHLHIGHSILIDFVDTDYIEVFSTLYRSNL